MRVGSLLVVIFFVLGVRDRGEASTGSHSGVDEHTIALWLFDEEPYPNVILTDAGPFGHDLRLVSGYAKWWKRNLEQSDDSKWYWRADPKPEPGEEPLHVAQKFGLVPGKFGRALRLPLGRSGEVHWPENLQRYGTAYLQDRPNQVPERLNLGYLDWTVEFWFKPADRQTSEGVILEWRNESDHRKAIPMRNALLIDRGRRRFWLVSQVLEGDPEHQFHLRLAVPSDSIRLNQGTWVHLAFTYTASERQVRHYVNGRLQPLPEPGGFLPMMGRVVSLQLGEGVHGLLDEFRISDVVRYTHDFSPPASFSRNQGLPRPTEVQA